jgi:hypothetical protein
MNIFQPLNYIEFRNIMKNNDVNLTDGQYRIAHFRLNNLVNTMNISNGNPVILLKKMCLKNKCYLNIFITSLVDNDKLKTNYILENYST